MKKKKIEMGSSPNLDVGNLHVWVKEREWQSLREEDPNRKVDANSDWNRVRTVTGTVWTREQESGREKPCVRAREKVYERER